MIGNVKELGIVVYSGSWCFVTSCDVVYVCNPLILKECSKVPLFQRYMSKSEKWFLGQRPSLLLFNSKKIYILIYLEHWNICLFSMTYTRFAWNKLGTFGTFVCFQ